MVPSKIAGFYLTLTFFNIEGSLGLPHLTFFRPDNIPNAHGLKQHQVTLNVKVTSLTQCVSLCMRGYPAHCKSFDIDSSKPLRQCRLSDRRRNFLELQNNQGVKYYEVSIQTKPAENMKEFVSAAVAIDIENQLFPFLFFRSNVSLYRSANFNEDPIYTKPVEEVFPNITESSRVVVARFYKNREEAEIIYMDCPKEYHRYKTKCFRVYNIEKTFEDSSLQCKNDSGRLAVIKDSKALDFVKSLLVDDTVYYWIGISDKQQEGVWVFEDGSLATYEFMTSNSIWAPNKPDNYTLQQDCAVIGSLISGVIHPFLNDEDCSKTERFVCETHLFPKTAIFKVRVSNNEIEPSFSGEAYEPALSSDCLLAANPQPPDSCLSMTIDKMMHNFDVSSDKFLKLVDTLVVYRKNMSTPLTAALDYNDDHVVLFFRHNYVRLKWDAINAMWI
ncbi:uncharacterized protein LOC143224295 [Tachypleus tridentatus]|uniref:uncharacterized protein LOC143224295 n=1 Tax=Tachypleus tridentatus TaxID=6853 RepID=UPI003FD48D76